MTAYVPSARVGEATLDAVRMETMASIERLEHSKSLVHAAPASGNSKAVRPQNPDAREARSKLVIATLNGNNTFDPRQHMDVPFDLWNGSDLAREYDLVPDELYLDGYTWRIKHELYSTGVCEIRGWLGKRPIKKQASSSFSSITPELSDVEKGRRFQSSIERSRSTLRKRATEQGADHLLTLTKRGKFDSIDAFWSAWDKFRRLCEKRFKHWSFVVVPEMHKDGTYHAHVALKGYYSAEALRICWYRALGGVGNESGQNTPGSANIKRIRRPHRGSGGAAVVRRIAAYISKYVGKGFDHSNRGRRLYASSRGLASHRVVVRTCNHRGGIAELCAGLLGELFGAGASGDGEKFNWSRLRRDSSSLQMCGFVLSTDWREVT